MRKGWAGLWECEPFRRSLTLYLVVRIVLSLWAVLVLALVPVKTGPAEPIRPYYGVPPVDGGVAGLLLGPWQRFDTLHYIQLATHGYQANTPHSVFPPLYPLLIRAVGGLLGGQYLLAALLVSNVCALGYLIVVFVLARQETGPAAASKAHIYVTLYPWAFILLAGYSESLFLLLAGLAFWLAQRGRGWMAGLCGALAALTRLQGVAVVLPLLFIALRQRGFRLWPLRLDLLWPLLPALACAGFVLGRAWAGLEPISVIHAMYWRQTFAFPWVSVAANLRNMLGGVAHPTDYLDLAAACMAIVLTVVAWRQLNPAYALYMTALTLLNVTHLRTPHPMCSVGRYTMGLFPGFFLLGAWGARHVWLNRLITYGSALLLMWLSGQFFLWGWTG